MNAPMTSKALSFRAASWTAIAFAAAAILSASAATIAPDGATVAVHAGHYVIGDRRYDDLDALEAAVRAAHPRAVRIVSCDAGATRAWLAAVPRFDDLVAGLEVPDASHPSCQAVAAMLVGARSGVTPSGIDDAAVKRYWDLRMP